MSRPQTIRILRSTTFALVATVGLGITGTSPISAALEDEIARLNRIRASLFEELVKTQAEAATARSERDEALKTRDAAEAELARLKQEAASAKPASPVLSAETKAPPQQGATTTASPTTRRQNMRPAAPAATGLVVRTATQMRSDGSCGPAPYSAQPSGSLRGSVATLKPHSPRL